MPNITVDLQELIKTNLRHIKEPGGLNYFITLILIRSFVSHPRYEMIHTLYRDFVLDPKHNNVLLTLELEFADIFTVADIRAAAALAYHEFHRRVVSRYEDIKVKLNGELPEYLALYKMLDALQPDHINEVVSALEAEEKILDAGINDPGV